MRVFLLSGFLILGLVTLSLARLAALVEPDAKKIVALSTLSQLGIMFLSISLRNFRLCLFHIVVHALAKANLFIIVGNTLHLEFAQQDSRALSQGRNIEFILIIGIIIRVLRLRGVIFISGFLSKEQIFIGLYSLLRRSLVIIGLFFIATITLIYCLKLVQILLSFRRRAKISTAILVKT